MEQHTTNEHAAVEFPPCPTCYSGESALIRKYVERGIWYEVRQCLKCYTPFAVPCEPSSDGEIMDTIVRRAQQDTPDA